MDHAKELEGEHGGGQVQGEGNRQDEGNELQHGTRGHEMGALQQEGERPPEILMIQNMGLLIDIGVGGGRRVEKGGGEGEREEGDRSSEEREI